MSKIIKVDFKKEYKESWAKFCHAISEMFAKYMVNPNTRPLPEGYTKEDLNFFNKNSKLMYIPWGLYSAGQAAKDDGRSKFVDMISARNREEVDFVVGDSGGYQIETGVIKWEGNKTKERMLRWLENNCEISMILDFPTGSIKKRRDTYYEEYCYDEMGNPVYDTIQYVDKNGKVKNKKIHKTIKHKLDFWFCLERTIENNEYFILNRVPGKTKFLNVLQGRHHDFNLNDEEIQKLNYGELSIEERKKLLKEKKISEVDAWYYSVKKFSTDYGERSFEGWAFAGNYKNSFDLTLRRLVIMLYEGMLEGKKWLHFLGMGQVDIICLYTVIQKMLRNHHLCSKDFTISCDASSAFSSAGAYGLVYDNFKLTKSGWTLSFDKLPEGNKYINSEEPWITVNSKINLAETLGSPISKIMTLGDLNVKKSDSSDDKKQRTMDGDSYAYLMHHNMYVLQKAVIEGQKIFEMKDDDAKMLIPKNVLEIKKVIEDLFCIDSKEKMLKYIKKHVNILRKLTISEGPSISEIENEELFSLSRDVKKKKLKNNQNIVLKNHFENLFF
ncbi:MAG: hypothetical protein ABIM64_05435 [candidate division WOR-3 bacterium]